MTISGAILGLPPGAAGWRLLQTKTPTDFTAFEKSPTLVGDIAYLRTHLPTKLTAKSLLADPRLQQIVLSAYGLDAQVGMTGLMEQILNSDLTNTNSLAARMNNAQFRQIANDFGYGGTAVPTIPAVPSSAQMTVDGLQPGQTVGTVSGTFGGLSIHGIDTSGATTRSQLAATLQAAFRRVDGFRSDISVTVFGTNIVFSDAKGRGAAKNFTFGGTDGATASLLGAGESAATPGSLPSAATVTVTGLQPGQTIGNFSGTFGGVTLTALDTSAATTRPQLAATLQAAFRKADGGATNISVAAFGDTLVFKDAQTRGGAKTFSFATLPGGATATLTSTTADNGTVEAPALLPTPSTTSITVQAFQPGQTVSSFSGTFGGVTLKNVSTTGATDWKSLASTLQKAFRTADAGRADISVTAFGHTLIFTDAQGRGGAVAPSFTTAGGATATIDATSGPTTAPLLPSTATLALSGLRSGQTIGSIIGTFGGVTPDPIDTSGATSAAALASTLQAAFQAADASSNITVAVNGDGNLVLTDAKGRGGATSFSFDTAGGPTVTLAQTTSGSPPIAAVGGPQVTNSSFIDALVARYTQAQFAQSVGDISQSLRQALYAKTMLPKVSNWYSVIADPNLAAVVHSILDLPTSFGAVNVDQQVNILKGRMNLADFKDPTKLAKLLDSFVAKASASETGTVTDPTGILSLFKPLDLSGSGSTNDSFSGASSAALFALL